MGDRITISLHLPAAIDDVAHILSVVADRWPLAKVDMNHEEGWVIELPPLPERIPGD